MPIKKSLLIAQESHAMFLVELQKKMNLPYPSAMKSCFYSKNLRFLNRTLSELPFNSDFN